MIVLTQADFSMTPRQLAEKVKDLYSLPEVALRVNEILQEHQPCHDELEAVIAHDPALAAKILKLVNTSYFDAPGKIDTISRAIDIVGAEELRNMVLATVVADHFSGIPDNMIDMNTFWYHSVNAGIIARLIAIHCNHIDQERFFIAGLLHSIGKLVLFSEYPDQCVDILHYRQRGQSIMTEQENKLFGFNHADLSAELLNLWKLPESTWLMIRNQLNPFDKGHPEYIEDGCILQSAVYIADLIEPCAKTNKQIALPELDIQLPAFKYLSLTEESLHLIIKEADFQAFEVLSLIRPETTVIF